MAGMGYITRRLCDDCGQPINKQHRPGKPYVCALCGIARGAAQALALHRHEPWAVEPWAAGLARAGISALAEVELQRVVGDTSPVSQGARLGGNPAKSRPDMRRARETRENYPATAQAGPG